MILAHGKRYTYIKHKCRCLDCVASEKAYQADYHAKNKEKRNEKTRAWRQENPGYDKTRENYKEIAAIKNGNRRALKKNAGSYSISKEEMSKLYASPCTYCGSSDNITIDHVIPLSRGGSHSVSNLVSACAKCNMSKGAKTVMEWKKK